MGIGNAEFTSIPAFEHCKSSVTRWKISRRKRTQRTKPGKKYLRGFLGRFMRFTFNGASSSSEDS
jgi:hypothetical protein